MCRSSASRPSGDSSRAASSLTRRLRPSRATTARRPCLPGSSPTARRYASSNTRSADRDRARSSASTALAAASASGAPGCGPHSAHSREATVTVPRIRPVPGASSGTLTAETSCHRSRKCSGPCTSARRRVRSARTALLWPTACSERSGRPRSSRANPVDHSTRSRSSVSTSAGCPGPRPAAIRSSTGRAAVSRRDSGGRTARSGTASPTSCRTPRNRARLHAETISSGTPSGSCRPVRNSSRALRSESSAGRAVGCSAVVTTAFTLPGVVERSTVAARIPRDAPRPAVSTLSRIETPALPRRPT